MRTTTVKRLALTADGTRFREVWVSVAWSPGFGTEATDDRQPQQEQKPRREPQHSFERKRRQPPTAIP
jgi:hypothetical protein